ncbi:MAG: class I SAM-dependent methyltransferase [Myxococcota bacterium]
MTLIRMAELGRLTRAALSLELVRTGIAAGLFEALLEPRGLDELAEQRGLAPDLCAAWLRAAHASGLVEYRAGRYRSGGLARWLATSPEGEAAAAWLDQTALGYAPLLQELPKLLAGAHRPSLVGRDPARASLARRRFESRVLGALGRVPGARGARRVLELGCGDGGLLAMLLGRYRDALGLGVERDPALAECARERLREARVERRADIWSGDVLREDLPAGDWELVLMNHVLPRFAEEERDRLFARLRTRMSPRGVLVIQTPVLRTGLWARLSGAAASTALLDLVLRADGARHPLPDPTELQVQLRREGFARVGSVPMLPGGAWCQVWATCEAVA